jgi:hypothetical protein
MMPGNPEPESPRAPEPGLHLLCKESSDGSETPCAFGKLAARLRARSCYTQLYALLVHSGVRSRVTPKGTQAVVTWLLLDA